MVPISSFQEDEDAKRFREINLIASIQLAVDAEKDEQQRRLRELQQVCLSHSCAFTKLNCIRFSITDVLLTTYRLF